MQQQLCPKISVFQQLSHDSYAWFRAGNEDEQSKGNHLVVDDIITSEELWERLGST
ncbi:MAG: hypothetical protein ABIP54_02280 [Candidatus Andersenbacteria bacterium]